MTSERCERCDKYSEALREIAYGEARDGKVPDWEFFGFAEDRERAMKARAAEALTESDHEPA